MFYAKFIKWEKYFFLILVLAHLLPVLAVDFFVTHDGPAHVYNASLIARILFHEPTASQFLMLNPQPEPNWTGHFLLAVMNGFFSPAISERILICTYIIALPFAFRKFILTINPQGAWASYLVFPFVHSFLLYMGFYNFCLGLSILFYALAHWFSPLYSFSWKKAILLSFLLLMLYFSHLFVLVLFFLAAGTGACVEFLQRTKKGDAAAMRSFFKKTGFLLAASLPSLLLVLNFIIHKPGGQNAVEEHSFSELLQWLLSARPVVTFKSEGEMPFAVTIAVTTGLLLINCIYAVATKKYSLRGNAFILFLFAILTFYFLIPDNFATGGFVSMRLVLIFYLFLFSCFAAAEIFPVLKIISVAAFIFVSLYFLNYHHNIEKILSEDAKEYYSLTDQMKDSSIVLPLFYSDNWMHNNLVSYVGTARAIFVLDNYEPYKPHFPLIWKPGRDPSKIMGNLGSYAPCVDIHKFESETKTKIDYITRWRFNSAAEHDSCTLALAKQLENEYERMYVSPSGGAELFKRRQ